MARDAGPSRCDTRSNGARAPRGAGRHMKDRLRLRAIIVAGVIGCFVGTGAREARADAPTNLRAALTKLQEARTELQQGAGDKAGHRWKALQQVNKAIGEVKQSIQTVESK